MAEETTNGNGRGGWVKYIPLPLALAASVTAGMTLAQMSAIRDDVQALKVNSAASQLDARVRNNTERIAAHETQSEARWDDVARQFRDMSRRLERVELRR